MAKGIVSKHVKCPYYKREERGNQIRIVCEGILEGTTQHHMFATLDALKETESRYCKRDYNSCPIARGLNEKYDYQ